MNFIKQIVGKFFSGIIICLGIQVGSDLYKKLKDPYEKAKLKKRFTKIKDAIFKKEEE